jgi:hypothetical protein
MRRLGENGEVWHERLGDVCIAIVAFLVLLSLVTWWLP